MQQHKLSQKGFTIIELLIVMGIIAILAAIVFISLNPAKHFAQARNTQRFSNVTAIADAIAHNMASNRGILTCPGGDPGIPATATNIQNPGGYNLAPCVVPTYLPSLPFDPGDKGMHYTSPTNYHTGYRIVKDEASGRITVSAPATELSTDSISVTR